MSFRVAYLIPEFPGQTHIWMWREIQHLRKNWGAEVILVSTRPPREGYCAKHSWAPQAAKDTVYLTGHGRVRAMLSLMVAALWAACVHPLGLVACVRLAFTLPIDARPRWPRLLALIPAACKLARTVEAAAADHLHCHTCANGAVLAMMCRRVSGVPFSMTLNANLEWWGGAMGEKIGDSAFTIAITQWLLDQIRKDYPWLGPGKAILGRIGVDTERWTCRSTDQEPSRETTFRLVSVGRLKVGKGHIEVIKAVQRLRATGKMVELRIIGDGPDRGLLEEAIARCGVAESVQLMGSLAEEQVMEELRRADTFVLASHTEPLGVVYMEAMALGVPTVGTTDGGVGEIISHGVDGLLVPPRNIDALVSTICMLMADRELRFALGRSGRRRIVESFDSRYGAEVLYNAMCRCHGVDESGGLSAGGFQGRQRAVGAIGNQTHN